MFLYSIYIWIYNGFVILDVRLIQSLYLSLLEESLIFLFFFMWKEIMESILLYTLFFCQTKDLLHFSTLIEQPFEILTFFYYNWFGLFWGPPFIFCSNYDRQKKFKFTFFMRKLLCEQFFYSSMNSLFWWRL